MNHNRGNVDRAKMPYHIWGKLSPAGKKTWDEMDNDDKVKILAYAGQVFKTKKKPVAQSPYKWAKQLKKENEMNDLLINLMSREDGEVDDDESAGFEAEYTKEQCRRQFSPYVVWHLCPINISTIMIHPVDLE